jgi:hypothetical protein
MAADEHPMPIEPGCPIHGQMHYRFDMDWWECPGWDGEGCGYRVTAEEWYRNITAH